jgi:hypothetical protein
VASPTPRPAPKLPAALTLPSGAVVTLRRSASRDDAPLAREGDAPLFEEVLTALASGRVELAKGGERLDPLAMALGDFHVVRAVLARSAVVAEEEIEVSCRNCEAKLRARPCAGLEVGPWVDGELDDPELDATLPFGAPIDVPPIALGRVRAARTVTFEARAVREARPLFAAAARTELIVDEALVRAMGLTALGAERDVARIAEALAACDDDAFAAVSAAFLDSHYVPRLACVVLCEACGARNDVDAPYERELVPSVGGPPRAGEHGNAGAEDLEFPSYEGLAARASELAAPLLEGLPGEDVELVIEDGVAAVDDGGEPLLGSYVPPHPGDPSTPSQCPVVTIYYRTFRAMWEEEGPYDWEGELAETIEHELEHHVSYLRGDDPTDDEERAVIRDEAVRIVGRREAGRRELAGFGASLRDFATRTWPLWLIAALALAATLATQR